MTEDKAHARQSDPDTSHEAAASVGNLTGRQGAILRFLENNLEKMMAMGNLRKSHFTDFTLVQAYQERFKTMIDGYPNQSDSGIRTRRKELVERGLIEDSGMRVKMPSGRKAIVWKRV